MVEEGVDEERPSLKMPKTKVIESKKAPKAEQEESEEEKSVDSQKPKKKAKKKKRVINGPEDYDMKNPKDRIAYNIDAADGVVDGKEGGEEEDEWLTDEEQELNMFEGGNKNKV